MPLLLFIGISAMIDFAPLLSYPNKINPMVGANVAGQIASVLAGGMILNLIPQLIK